MKLTLGAKLFLIGLMLVPVLLIGFLVVDETDFIAMSDIRATRELTKKVYSELLCGYKITI